MSKKYIEGVVTLIEPATLQSPVAHGFRITEKFCMGIMADH